MVPFQFDIMRSSPSARPYEHASIIANPSAELGVRSSDGGMTNLHLAPSRPSRALPVSGSSSAPWQP